MELLVLGLYLLMGLAMLAMTIELIIHVIGASTAKMRAAAERKLIEKVNKYTVYTYVCKYIHAYCIGTYAFHVHMYIGI